MNHRVSFDGNFLEYFLVALGLLVLCAVTFGLATPYLFY